MLRDIKFHNAYQAIEFCYYKGHSLGIGLFAVSYGVETLQHKRVWSKSNDKGGIVADDSMTEAINSLDNKTKDEVIELMRPITREYRDIIQTQTYRYNRVESSSDEADYKANTKKRSGSQRPITLFGAQQNVTNAILDIEKMLIEYGEKNGRWKAVALVKATFACRGEGPNRSGGMPHVYSYIRRNWKKPAGVSHQGAGYSDASCQEKLDRLVYEFESVLFENDYLRERPIAPIKKIFNRPGRRIVAGFSGILN